MHNPATRCEAFVHAYLDGGMVGWCSLHGTTLHGTTLHGVRVINIDEDEECDFDWQEHDHLFAQAAHGADPVHSFHWNRGSRPLESLPRLIPKRQGSA